LKTFTKLLAVLTLVVLSLLDYKVLPTGTLSEGTRSLYVVFNQELHCLADNIYYESRNQGSKGMYLVAEVTRNRVESKKFPDSYCKVVYQPWQFSWTAKKAKQKPLQNTRELQARKKAVMIAYETQAKSYKRQLSKNTLYFCTTKVNPSWKAKGILQVRHKDHEFYEIHKG
jgi:spore germination cell wall hydrolase CwlJ-like protein